jgi:hypothetical protein
MTTISTTRIRRGIVAAVLAAAFVIGGITGILATGQSVNDGSVSVVAGGGNWGG